MLDTAQPKVTDILFEFISNNFPLAQNDSLSLDDKLIEKGIVDSLGLFLVIEFIETSFEISVQFEDVGRENFGSINAISDYIIRSLKNKQN